MPALSEVLAFPPLRWILALLKLLLLGSLLWFLLHTGWMIWDGLTEELNVEERKAHVAVVFGNEIMPDGKVSDRLKARLDRALDLYRDGDVDSMIVSGGVDDAGHDEASLMGRYLLRNGVPQEAIMVDSLGDDSYMTATNVRRILQNHQTRRVLVVVTSWHHVMRAKLALNKCGFKVVYGAYGRHLEWRDIWYSIPKEFAAFYWYLNRPCPEPFVF
ncbi:MAG: YdcF family protein [Candidatus Melainabacteria bacterium HGW-Melainabacteria-1]|nr:MAG: YdcF family protein [Candidatus Melainabacteria bacterium HGW-Melainabacteria-1]